MDGISIVRVTRLTCHSANVFCPSHGGQSATGRRISLSRSGNATRQLLGRFCHGLLPRNSRCVRCCALRISEHRQCSQFEELPETGERFSGAPFLRVQHRTTRQLTRMLNAASHGVGPQDVGFNRKIQYIGVASNDSCTGRMDCPQTGWPQGTV